MTLNEDLLITWGGVAKKYHKSEFIFSEGDFAHFFYYIIKGTVKMVSTNFDGKEFNQGEFKSGCSFGEPPLFIDEAYPASAVACEESVIIRLSKEKFFQILDEYTDFQRDLIRLFAQRIYSKSSTLKDIMNNSPDVRILAFLDAYKKKNALENNCIEIPFTRQEIANFTGLRVETVIRALSKMNKIKKVQIVNHKLIY